MRLSQALPTYADRFSPRSIDINYQVIGSSEPMPPESDYDELPRRG